MPWMLTIHGLLFHCLKENIPLAANGCVRSSIDLMVLLNVTKPDYLLRAINSRKELTSWIPFHQLLANNS